MNLKVLKRSRHKPKAGDIFVMQLLDYEYLYGRVINIDADPLGVGVGILIYIYSARSNNKLLIPKLSIDDLLIPPIITNRLPWSKGYFEHVEYRELMPQDILKQHSFFDSFRKCYCDEYGNTFINSGSIVGDWGLHSYRTIDDAISTALGIPLSED